MEFLKKSKLYEKLTGPLFSRPKFDLNELKQEFKKHVPDYMEDLDSGMKPFALHFCKLYFDKVQPKSIRKEEKAWKFTVKVKTPVEEIGSLKTEVFVVETHTIFVVKYKPKNHAKEENAMILSVAEAELIAMDTFFKWTCMQYRNGSFVLTTLAKACFSKGSIIKMAEELTMPELELIAAINESTCIDSHYLPHSNVNIAICTGTKGIEDESKRQRIRKSISARYRKFKQQVADKKVLGVIDKYCIGGVFEYHMKILQE